MKVKICGITNLHDALLAEKLGADFLGFNFSKHSPRCITPIVAKNIINKLSNAKPVGLFIEQTENEIKTITNFINLHAIQVYHSKLVIINHVKNIHPLRIKDKQSLENIDDIPADYLLCDTYVEDQYGGSGKIFDWELIPKTKKPLFIAGGITPENVAIVKQYQPYAIDLCSGVEDKPGIKNERKLQQLFEEL